MPTYGPPGSSAQNNPPGTVPGSPGMHRRPGRMPRPEGPPPAAPPRYPPGKDIANCMYTYTLVWPKRGAPFWFYPTGVRYNRVSGYVWTGRYWAFFAFNPATVERVACYPSPMPY